MVTKSVNLAAPLDRSIVAFLTLAFLSMYRSKSRVRDHDYVLSLELFQRQLRDSRIGAVIDKDFVFAIRLFVDLILPLHQSLRWRYNKSRVVLL